MRWKKWGSVIVSVNRAQKGEVEKMEVSDSMRWVKWRSVVVSVNRVQKDEMATVEICDSICEQGTER